eukprot:scaffold11416_cov119-Isochrysis_galbana.AAC.6
MIKLRQPPSGSRCISDWAGAWRRFWSRLGASMAPRRRRPGVRTMRTPPLLSPFPPQQSPDPDARQDNARPPAHLEIVY